MAFRYGIEHETAFINAQGQFADYLNTPFEDYAQIIEPLPKHDGDYPMLRVGDAGIKLKRWYIEGFERFADDGQVISCAPKGIEIRTTIHESISGVVSELAESFQLMTTEAARSGYRPALVSYHPFHKVFKPEPPLSAFELKRRQGSPEKQTANIPMLTQGPDLSLSCADFSVDETIYAARKLTAYSPYLIPFSFSSPFYAGDAWEGLSVRTYQRTGARPAVLAFIDDPAKQLQTNPSLTQMARVAAEAGRIEFKAFDSCSDFSLYGALLSLLKGVILDDTLPLSADVPDTVLHQYSAKFGFHDDNIYEKAGQVLSAASRALPEEEDRRNIDLLFNLLDQRAMPAGAMKQAFQQGTSIEDVMLAQYAL